MTNQSRYPRALAATLGSLILRNMEKDEAIAQLQRDLAQAKAKPIEPVKPADAAPGVVD